VLVWLRFMSSNLTDDFNINMQINVMKHKISYKFSRTVEGLLTIYNSMTNAVSLNPQQTRQTDCCCTFLSPPPGLCLMFAVDPTLDLALISIFWSRICNRGNYSFREGNQGMSYVPLYSQLAKWSNSSLRLV